MERNIKKLRAIELIIDLIKQNYAFEKNELTNEEKLVWETAYQLVLKMWKEESKYEKN